MKKCLQNSLYAMLFFVYTNNTISIISISKNYTHFFNSRIFHSKLLSVLIWSQFHKKKYFIHFTGYCKMVGYWLISMKTLFKKTVITITNKTNITSSITSSLVGVLNYQSFNCPLLPLNSSSFCALGLAALWRLFVLFI